MSEALLDSAIGRRHGILPEPVAIDATPADLPDISNWSVGRFELDAEWTVAGGGVGWTREQARAAAIAEALERYAAVEYPLPIVDGRHRRLALDRFTLFDQAQRSHPAFPHRAAFENPSYTDAFTVTGQEPVEVPAALVGLTDSHGALPTSSGLAAGATPAGALLRALQELIERDALMAIWLHGVVPGRVELPAHYTEPVAERGGWVVAFEITPIYSPHPVAMVVGSVPLHGRPRLSLGSACRSSWASAADKAYLEWTQGVMFAGYRLQTEPDLWFPAPDDVRTFDDHAVYYTVHPDRWQELPFVAEAGELVEPPAPSSDDPIELARSLEDSGFHMLYRDLTLPDLRHINLTVVRVLSPDLTPIHADHRLRHLGGTTPDLARRFPNAASHGFPSPHPHPLG